MKKTNFIFLCSFLTLVNNSSGGRGSPEAPILLKANGIGGRKNVPPNFPLPIYFECAKYKLEENMGARKRNLNDQGIHT